MPDNVLHGKCFALNVQGESVIDADMFGGMGSYASNRLLTTAIIAMAGEEATAKWPSAEGLSCALEDQKLKPHIEH